MRLSIDASTKRLIHKSAAVLAIMSIVTLLIRVVYLCLHQPQMLGIMQTTRDAVVFELNSLFAEVFVWYITGD